MTCRKRPGRLAFPPPCANRRDQAFRTPRGLLIPFQAKNSGQWPAFRGYVSHSARRYLAPRLSAQPFNLLGMMSSMHPVKLSPLRRRQRTQNRMIQHFAVSEASLALLDDPVHRGNLRPNFRLYLLYRQTSWNGMFGCLPSRRHVAKSQDNACPHVLSYRCSTHHRLTRLEHSFKSLHRSRIS